MEERITTRFSGDVSNGDKPRSFNYAGRHVPADVTAVGLGHSFPSIIFLPPPIPCKCPIRIALFYRIFQAVIRQNKKEHRVVGFDH